MNISERTTIHGIEKTGCKRSHLAHCLNDRNMHTIKAFDYNGKHVLRGKVLLYTKNGTFEASFYCQDGWLKYLNF